MVVPFAHYWVNKLAVAVGELVWVPRRIILLTFINAAGGLCFLEKGLLRFSSFLLEEGLSWASLGGGQLHRGLFSWRFSFILFGRHPVRRRGGKRH